MKVNSEMTSTNAFYRALILLVVIALAPISLASDFPVAEKVVVEKDNRKLHLVKGDEVFRTFDIALGFAPVGDKQAEEITRHQKVSTRSIPEIPTATISCQSVFPIRI